MARKSKPAPSPAASSARSTETPRSSSVSTTTKRKRTPEVDWTTVNEKTFDGFRLVPVKDEVKTAKKRRTNGQHVSDDWRTAPMDALIVQPNPFPKAELSETRYLVDPPHLWEAARRFRKFTISEYPFEINDIIFVKSHASEDTPNAVVKGWLAKVLEVRGGDENHVYLRIYWIYRPEDLPGGRAPYHGKNELIVSNDMAIIDALTVQGKANVKHWQEKDHEQEVLNRDQLFWRQTYDTWTTKRGELSQLPKHCVENTPCNPDEILVQCESCEKWLHGSCLEEDAVIAAYEAYDLEYPKEPARKGKGRRKKVNKRGRRPSGAPAFTADITTLDSSGKLDPTGRTRLIVTDRRKGEENRCWEVPIKCLLCDAIIEDVEEDESAEDESSMISFSVPTHDADTLNKSKSNADKADTPASLSALSPTPTPPRPRHPDPDEDSVFGKDSQSQELRDKDSQAFSFQQQQPNESYHDKRPSPFRSSPMPSEPELEVEREKEPEPEPEPEPGKELELEPELAPVGKKRKRSMSDITIQSLTSEPKADDGLVQSSVRSFKRFFWNP